jgi:hypothetical protein
MHSQDKPVKVQKHEHVDAFGELIRYEAPTPAPWSIWLHGETCVQGLDNDGFEQHSSVVACQQKAIDNAHNFFQYTAKYGGICKTFATCDSPVTSVDEFDIYQAVFTAMVLSGKLRPDNRTVYYKCSPPATKIDQQMSVIDQADCENMCLDNEQCQSYNWLNHVGQKKCTLHSGIGIAGPDTGAICFVKGPPPTPAPTTNGDFRATMVGDLHFKCDSTNPILKHEISHTNQATCEDMCLDDDSCQSYNYNDHEYCTLHSGIFVHKGADALATCWVKTEALQGR